MQIQPTIESNLELDLLEHIHAHKAPVHQRDLATIISKSLGMTNSILKRLTEKGLLTIAKVNNRNISYAVTPEGMRELTKRSYRYVKRTIRNVVDFKDAIEAEIIAYKQTHHTAQPGVILFGKSDVDFIIEHLAEKHGIKYGNVQIVDSAIAKDFCEKLVFLTEDTDLPEYEKELRDYLDFKSVVIVSIRNLITND